jgi:hypothetical protein
LAGASKKRSGKPEPQQGQQQERLVAVAARTSTRTSRQRRRTALLAQVHRQSAEAEHVQSGDEGEGIEMQRGTTVV